MQARMLLLQQWVAEQLGAGTISLKAVSGDASFRRYFRVSLPLNNSVTTLIAVDSPPDKESNPEFIRIAQILFAKGFFVPEIKAVDVAQGFMLLSDLGDRLLLPELNEDNVDQHYQAAMSTLLRLQGTIKPDELSLPQYEQSRLLSEMTLFTDWFIPCYLEYTLSPGQAQDVRQGFQLLAASALEQPVVFVHRDYHARNLMVLETGQQAMIDFQDAVWGPVTYDLVSILRDCYVRWPRERTLHWARNYLVEAKKIGLLPLACTELQFVQWFEWMGVQRHLKATGIFARLNYRDHKPVYLSDIPRTYSYMLEVTAAYPELASLHRVLLTLAHHLMIKNPTAATWLKTLL
jgi:aminoglycoside/choline kinase family phosphotransferase